MRIAFWEFVAFCFVPSLLAQTFQATGSLSVGRRSHQATLLRNGSVLVTGGEAYNSPGLTATAEIFDSATGTWRVTNSPALQARAGHTATLLKDGRVLLTGGSTDPRNCEIYDPSTDLFYPAAPMTYGRSGHAAVLLSDGRVIVVGGYEAAPSATIIEAYSPTNDSWNVLGAYPGLADEGIALIPLSDGTILAAGGFESNTQAATKEVYRYAAVPAPGTWLPMTSLLSDWRSGFSALSIPGDRVLFIGGAAWGNPLVPEVYSPFSGATGSTTPTAWADVPDGFAATTLPNGNVLVTGGSHITRDAYYIPTGRSSTNIARLFDSRTLSWISIDQPMTDSRAYHTSTLLYDGRVLLSAGERWVQTGQWMAFYSFTNTAEIWVDPGSNPAYYGTGNSTTNRTVTVAEPVNSATGNYFSTFPDLSVRGRGLSFQFTRYYNSLDPSSGPLGQGWTHSYNLILTENGQTGQVAIKQPDGSTVSFMALGNGQYAAATTGLFDTLNKNADGSFTLTRKNQTKLNFTAAGKLTSIIDRNGNTQTLAYNSSGTLATIADTAGRVFSFSYDLNNRLISLLDPSGRTVHYSYDSFGNLTSYKDALGNITQYAYDSNNRLISGTDPRGVVYVQNTYDSQGRVILQKNGRGFSTTFAYNTPSAGITTITDPLGNITRHVYDIYNRIIQEVDALGGATSYVYDGNNNRTAITDANGNTAQFSYDSFGNVTAATDPLGNTTSFTHDALNDVTSSTDAAGHKTTFSYDTKGNLTSTQDALGNTTTFTYDALGELTGTKDVLGNKTTMTYDPTGNLLQLKDALANSRSFGYDTISRPISATDANGHTSSVSYDALGHRTKTTDALGAQTQYTYDSVGNLVKLLDAKGNATAYQYDATNNLLAVTDALGKITAYAYDANNNRLSFSNAKGNTTTYAYDPLNRRTKVTDPLGFFTSYSYDPVGNLVSVTDANGKTHSFSYDALNRPTTRSYADGNAISYAYDVNGNRTAMTDSHGTTGYSYDVLNRLSSVTDPSGKTLAYAYDGMGNRTSLTYPDERVMLYAYDAMNRLSQVTDWASRRTSYGYDAAGNLINAILANGASSTYTYDNDNRIAGIVNRAGVKVLSSFAYTLDVLGNRVQVLDAAGGITRYAYDPLNQLTSWTAPSSQVTSYAYDAVGNRTSVTSSAGTTAYGYDAADRLLNAGTTTFLYDNNGNLLSKTTGSAITKYSFDSLNRLTSVAAGASNVGLSYDGDGNRVALTNGTTTTSYVNDIARRYSSVLNETGSNGSVDYIYGLSLISATAPLFEQFYQQDGLGSAASVTDQTGTLKVNYTYDPWGKLLNAIDPLGSKNSYKFTGEALDSATSLYFLRARYYDASVGRFISKDPLPHRDQVSRKAAYVYAGNSPVQHVDPTGLSFDTFLQNYSRAFTQTITSLPSFAICGGGVFSVGNSCKQQGLADWQVAFGSDVGTAVIGISTGGTGLLIKSSITGTIEAGTLVYKGVHAQLTPSDLLNASEDALTSAVDFELPDTAKYAFNAFVLPSILSGPSFVDNSGVNQSKNRPVK